MSKLVIKPIGPPTTSDKTKISIATYTFLDHSMMAGVPQLSPQYALASPPLSAET
jgi:hypothetical protein